MKVFLEGGGGKDLDARCREAFRAYIDRLSLTSRPKLVACGGRAIAFDRFRSELRVSGAGAALLWIDSEDPLPVTSPTQAWAHLKRRDEWQRPEEAADEDVLFLATCLETWIVADRTTLASHYGSGLQPGALPSLAGIESRPPAAVYDALEHATRHCKNPYRKGRRAFAVFGKLRPSEVERSCSQAIRSREIIQRRCR